MILIAGPCVIESRELIMKVAESLRKFNEMSDGWKHHLSTDGASLASKFDPSERTLKIEGNDKPLVLFFYASSRILKF